MLYHIALAFLRCGERGIRTPGPVTVNGFQDRRIRPLCHLSEAKVRLLIFFSKKIILIVVVLYFFRQLSKIG